MRAPNAQKRKTVKMEGWNYEENQKDDVRYFDGHYDRRDDADVKSICSTGNYINQHLPDTERNQPADRLQRHKLASERNSNKDLPDKRGASKSPQWNNEPAHNRWNSIEHLPEIRSAAEAP
jgi:hypothetical protein